MSANIFEDELEDSFDRDGFRHRGTEVGRRAGTERLGASLYELDPEQASCPYHWHAGNEELLMVLSGTVALRTPDGTREVGAGEVVAFPRGERGAHQLTARGDQPARFLMLSELNSPDICVYPDSDKVGVRHYTPGDDEADIRLNFRASDAVDYWDGEEPPR
jgi:uncharacterized cupin superfamily protein